VDRERAAAIVRVIERNAKSCNETRPFELPAPLRRGGRSVAEWLKVLRGRGRDAYRSPPVERESLWDVLESVATPPQDRLAAAIVLAKGLSADERERMKRAADSAHPALRKGLAVALASGDDAALIRLLT